jgi:Ca-activated chloride channel family protein
MLWLLLAVPALIGAYVVLLRRRKIVAMSFPDLGIIKQGLDGPSRFKRHIPPALLLIAISLIIVAGAQPTTIATLASRGGTIIMALDVSGSMRASDVVPTRIAAAQIAAKSLVNSRARQTRIGIVGFSSSAFLVQTPTTDNIALVTAIDGLRPQYATAIGDAVLVSLKMIFSQPKMGIIAPGSGGDRAVSADALNRSTGSNPPATPAPQPVLPGSYRAAAIVLMTDGQNTSGPDPIEAARVAANLGVRVFTIGFGTPNGQTIDFDGRQILAILDEDTLKKMASMTNAQYFHAQSAAELTMIYKQLTAKLQNEPQETEITVFFVAAATIFCTLSALLSLLWFHPIF